MLSKHAFEEYKEIHREETGEVLSDDALFNEATNLLTLLDRVYRPIKKEWLKEYEQRTRDNTGVAKRKTKVAIQGSSQSESKKLPPPKAD